MLDADGQTDEGIGQSNLLTGLHRHTRVRHDGRRASQRLHRAEGHGQAKDLELGQELAGSLEATLDEDGHHSASAVGLRLGKGLLGVRGEAGVVHLVDQRVLLEELSNALGVAGGRLHADGEGLQATQGEVAVEGRRHGTGEVLQSAHLGVDGVRVGQHGTHEHIGVTSDVLGHGVDHHIGTEAQRALQVRRHEGGIHNHDQTTSLGEGGDLADVGGLQERVGGGLQPDHLGLGGDGSLHLGGVVKVHEGEVNAHVGSGHLTEVTGGTAIKIIEGNHVVTGVQQLDGRLRSSKTGREGRAVLGTFGGSKGTLESSSGRVALAGVEVSVAVRSRVLNSRLLARVSLDEGGGQSDGRNHGVRNVLGFATSVDNSGLDAVLVVASASEGLSEQAHSHNDSNRNSAEHLQIY